MNYKTQIIALFLAGCVSALVYPMNLLLRPYDTLLRPEVHLNRCYELSFWAEGDIKPAIAFDNEGHSVNPLAIWNANQNTLAMLEGFGQDTAISNFRSLLQAQDDGVRGHVVFDGNLQLDFGGAFGARWYFLPHAWITTYLPFYKTRLTDITTRDLTQTITPADFRVKNLLTDDLKEVVARFGNGLSLDGWKRTGLGDLNIMVEWLFNFPQERPILKNVQINGRVGLTLPTGLKTDEDKLFAFAYGYDGATGILFGGGLNVLLAGCLSAGMDVQLLHLFGNTRIRRIKTTFEQSELLLLAKTKAYKDYGLTQRFNLFLQAYKIYHGVSFLAGYQFLKQGESHLAFDTCEFSATIANTARNLDEWIVHSFEFTAHYDFNSACWHGYEPQLMLFARVPFNGKNSAAFTTVGVMAAIDF